MEGDKLIISLGSGRFALDTKAVAGIIEQEKLPFLPGRSGFVSGIVSFRNEPVTVIDLSGALGDFTETAGAGHKIIILSVKGRLLGIGSLVVGDAMGTRTQVPGNMFVPIDLLKPILADLKSQGRPARAARPWLGMMTEEVQGRLFVSRVSAESPADQAGIKPGDIVIGVGATPVKTHAELYRRMWALGPAGTEVPLKVLQDGGTKDIRVKSIDRSEFFRKKPTH